jgi:hypothetical protein
LSINYFNTIRTQDEGKARIDRQEDEIEGGIQGRGGDEAF